MHQGIAANRHGTARPIWGWVLVLAAVGTYSCNAIFGFEEGQPLSPETGTSGGSGGGTSSGTPTGAGGAGGDGGEPGAHLWSARYGDDGVENAAGVVVASSGSIVIAGDFTSTIDFGGGSITNDYPPGRDAFVSMLDSDGSHRWTDHIWGDHEEVIESVAVDASNNILLAGWFDLDLEAPRGAQHFSGMGGGDAFFMKLDAAGDYQWGYRPPAAGGYAERATGITAGPGNDAVVVGHFEQWIEFGSDHHELLVNHGPNNAFVAAYNAGGSDLWSAQLGEWGHQEPADVAALADGSVIVVGNCNGNLTLEVACTSSNDVFVVKYDASQVLEWATVYGDGGTEHPHAVASSGDELVVVGDFDSQIDFDPSSTGALTSYGSQDMFVAKLRGDGSHVWSHSFGGLDDDIAYDVTIGSTGRVIVTGGIRDVVDFGDGEHDCTDADVFVLVLDQDGNVEYSKRFGEAGDQEGRSVAVDSDGNIVLFGNMRGSIDFGGGLLTSAGSSQDVFVVKLAP